MKKVEACYRTSDGQDFTDKKQAEKHEELLQAYQRYDDARKNLNRKTVQQRTTADGVLIDLSPSRTFYHIEYGRGLPAISEMPYLGDDFHLCGDIIYLRGYIGEKVRTFNISRLYAVKKNAEKAWIVESEKKIKELQWDIEQVKQRMGL